MNDKKYISLILLHILIDFNFPNSAFITDILIAILAFGLYYVMKTQNRNNEVLYVAGYCWDEVFLRMTEKSVL